MILRAAITRRLIEEQGFEAVLVEADWPDALYHLPESSAVEPLAPGASWQREAIPDAYPFGV